LDFLSELLADRHKRGRLCLSRAARYVHRRFRLFY